MKMKPALKYHLSDYRNVLLVTYVCVYIFAFIMGIGRGKIKNSACGGLEFISMIMIFVLGISSFKPYFKFFSANGRSRKTVFCTAIAGLGCISVIMAFIDTLNTLLFSQNTNYQSLFLQSYYRITPGSMFDANIEDIYSALHYTFPMIAQQFLWSIFAYLWIATIGFLIAVLYYRMNKGLKITVSFSVPVLLIFVLPILDRNLWGNWLENTQQNFFNFAWGYSNGYNPYIGMASMFIFAAVNAALAWLLVRRASVKA